MSARRQNFPLAYAILEVQESLTCKDQRAWMCSSTLVKALHRCLLCHSNGSVPKETFSMRLEIYVADHCDPCQHALLIAEEAKRIPGLEVAVITLDETTPSTPPNVNAVPTYLLDGRVVSLGNPAQEAFLAYLRQHVEEHVS
jgi:hypothetical protein